MSGNVAAIGTVTTPKGAVSDPSGPNKDPSGPNKGSSRAECGGTVGSTRPRFVGRRSGTGATRRTATTAAAFVLP